MSDLVPFTGLIAGDADLVYAANSVVLTGTGGTVLVNSNIYIDGSGNVGVGTTNPTDKLSIVGNILVSGSGKGIRFPDGSFQTTSATSTPPGGTTGAVQYKDATGNFAGSANTFYFDPNSVQLGIGTNTITAGSKLELADGNIKIATSTKGIIFPDGSFQTTSATSTPPGGTTGAVQYRDSTGNFSGDSSNFYYNSSSVQVGIGTNSVTAGSKLELVDGNIKIATSTKGIVFPDGTFQITSATSTPPGGTTGAIQYKDATGNFAGSSSTFYFDSSAVQVGIGTGTISTATTKLAIYDGNLQIATDGHGLVFPDGTIQKTALNIASAVTAFSAGLTGFTPNTSSTGSITLNGTLNETHGGTNQTAYATGDILYASGSNTLARLAIAPAGNVLISGTTPSWGLAYSSNNSSSTLVVRDVNGSFSSNVITATNATITSNLRVDTAVGIGTTTIGEGAALSVYGGNVHIGTLTKGIVFADGSYQDTALASSSAVISFSAGTTGLTPTLATTGAVTLGGTLALTNGGTGNSLVASNGGIVWSGDNSMQILAASATNGNVLISGGAASPSWGAYYTSLNVGGSLVARDNNGGFAAGNIFAQSGLTVFSNGAKITGSSTVYGNLTVTGSLMLSGNVYVEQANVLIVNDPMIYVGNDNPADTFDLGVVGSYTTDAYKHTGFVRNHTDGVWTVFDNLLTEPTGTLNWSQEGLAYGDIKVGESNITATTAAVALGDGALRVAGGASVSGNAYVGGNIYIANSGRGLWFPDGTYQNSAPVATPPGGSTGAVQYKDSTGNFAGDTTNFYYDSTNFRVGIGTNDTNVATLHVSGGTPALFNTLNSGDPAIIVGNSVTTGSTIGYNAAGVYGYLKSSPGGTQILTFNNTGVGVNGVFPQNALDVSGAIAVGGIQYAGATIAPSNGMIVQGDVGIGTNSPQYKLHVVGSFAATSKSFVIDHPTKPGMKLRHGSLEGPENGVYLRGRTSHGVIELPDYWKKLIDPESITVNITPIGEPTVIAVTKIENNRVHLSSESECFFMVLAERVDVEKMQIEF